MTVDGEAQSGKECVNTESEKGKKNLLDLGLTAGNCVENKEIVDDGKKLSFKLACLCTYDRWENHYFTLILLDTF